MRNCSPTQLQTICPSGYGVNDCGRPEPPTGEYVDLACNLVFATLLGANTEITNARKRVFADCDFILCSMSVQLDPANPTTDYYYKWQYPDGRYASNIRQSVLLTGGVGNRRRTFYPAELYQAGSFISFELANTTGTAVTVAIIFEGLKRLYLKNNQVEAAA